MERPTVKHLQTVKRVLRYVVGTLDYGLHYKRAPGMARFIDYYDSDLAGDIDTSRSTRGTMFFLGDCLVSWQSIKQKVVALSSCEAEYIATSTAATQELWHIFLAVQAAWGAAWQKGGCGGVEGGQQVCFGSG
jgi:hypothetical protein